MRMLSRGTEGYLKPRKTGIFGLFKPPGGPAILRTAAGFSDFFEQAHLPVFRYLFGLTGGPQQDVEDLAAEAFTRAWRQRRSFSGDADAALGWLMKIARHLVIDNYRRRKARPVMADDIPEGLSLADPPPEEAALAEEDQERLWLLLRALADEPREILVLRYLLGWRVNQVAEYLEIPENTVSVTIRRTLERLRKQWPA
jgi:RNA polymerase sigma-70 factor (ECF subfamily)